MTGEAPLNELRRLLRGYGSVLVAFSGGADSAFLLAAATRTLGPERVRAATAVSPSLPAPELSAAVDFAAGLGVQHLTPSTDELSRQGYRVNAGDRCFFCKTELLETLAPLANRHELAYVATGTNADDVVAGFRPGIRAAADRGAVTPLAQAGFTKDQVRQTSRAWGLSTWDKPAAACLSSRIAYGIEVTSGGLARVERAETRLRAALPVRNLRVRDMGDDHAKIEVDAELTAQVAARDDLAELVDGFATVTVDERGFRSGAMNELLSDPEKYR